MYMKRQVSFFIFSIILLFLGSAQNVYAVTNWQLTRDGWKYCENGIIKIGWILTGGSWYYLNDLGVMETGWINDNGTWYYLYSTGAMDNSKTTTTMPGEIKKIFDVVRIHADLENIKYDCIYHANSSGIFGESGFAGEDLYKFHSENANGDKINEYYYEPDSGNIYELKKGAIKLLGTSIVNDVSKIITSDKAVEKVKEYLKNNDKYVPSEIEYIYEHDDYYIIHAYDITGENSNTDKWYYVSKINGDVTSMA
jgi:hypothetical protein